MDAKDLRTEAALGDRTKDGTTSYSQSGAAERPKTYADAGSSPMAKVEGGVSRPCAVIGPDRVVPPGARRPEQWPPDYRQPPAYPHKPLDYHHPTRNISPRQTFQENMQRIMVSPSYATTKHKEDHNLQLQSEMSPLRSNKINVSTETKFADAYPIMPTVRDPKNARVPDVGVPKFNVSTETKYCDVPYPSNPIINDPKTVRTSDVGVSHTNSVLTRSASQGWPPGAPLQPPKSYGASELFQYPEYHSCAAPRPMVMGHPHRTVQEISGMPTDSYYHDGNVRFKPYPTSKERYPQARYDYVSNYPNPIHAPPFSTHKVVPSNPYPGYSQVPLKYMDTRMSDPLMNAYQRAPNPQAGYSNISLRNPVMHPSYGPVQGNCLQNNKFYPYPDTAAKAMAPSKLPPYPDYESARPKPYPVPDGFYINDIARPHLMKSQVMPPNYANPNMHMMHPHPYYRKDNVPIKNFDHSGHYRSIDPSINVSNNPLPRFATQFTNTVQMSPSDLMTNNTTNMMQPNIHNFSEDFGYISQSSSASNRSYDSGMSRFSNDPFRRYDYNKYGPAVKTSFPPKFELYPNNNQSSKDKKDLDVRQFLQMWNEGEEENENNSKDSGNKTVTISTGVGTQTQGAVSQSATQEQLYVMGIVNVPSEELDKYEHIQKVSKLPENIKGYNSIEILHKFEEVIESSKLNEHKQSAPSPRNFRAPLKNSFQSMQAIAMPSRPLSPFDVEAKISQSVIHKDVGCNFEIKPCSPKMMNVQRATPIQNVISERTIEKVTNPVVIPTPNVHNSIDNENDINIIQIKCGDPSLARNENNVKKPCCKLTEDSYSKLNLDSIAKPSSSYSFQDLESNSGVCFASLPRLDNDIELSFPEVNQQFINANKIDSVITSMSAQDLPLLDVEEENENIEKNQETPKLDSEIPTLSKHRKHKRKSSEPTERNLISSVKAIRTDSVIIKNPDTYKHVEVTIQNSPKTDSGETSQKDPINLTMNTEHYASNVENNGKMCEELAIDFSLNSNERCSNNSETQNLSFNKRKDSGPEHQPAENDNDGLQNFQFDSRVNDMHCIGYTNCNLEKATPNDCEESNLSVTRDNNVEKSDTLEKELTVFQASKEITAELEESNINRQTDFSELTEKSKQPFISKPGIEVEEMKCTEKYILSGETPEIRFTSFLNDSDQDLHGAGINTKEMKKEIHHNEEKNDLQTDNPKSKESLLKSKSQALNSLCQSFITGDLISKGIEVNTCERSRSNSCESISFTEYPEHESFKNNLDQRNTYFKCNIDECNYEGNYDNKNIKNVSTPHLSTMDDDKMLEDSDDIFLEQPLTPMDVTPASSFANDDTDDCFLEGETEKNEDDDCHISIEIINDNNIQIQRTSYFSKELFSPWIRKLILREGDSDHKPQKYIFSETERIPENRSKIVKIAEKHVELSENLKSAIELSDVQDIPNLINFDPDTVKSDPPVDTAIDKTSNKINLLPTELPDGKVSEPIQSEDPILSDNRTVEGQSDILLRRPNSEKTAAVTNEKPLEIINFSDVRLVESNDKVNQKPANTDSTINTFTLETASLPATSCAERCVTHDSTPADSVPKEKTEPADCVPKKESAVSLSSSQSDSKTELGDKCNSFSDKKTETLEFDSKIMKKSDIANVSGELRHTNFDEINESPSIHKTPKQHAKFDMLTVEIVKKLPKNCLEALKNEYGSDSEESVTDNEVERIKHEYASDTDELIENDLACEKNEHCKDSNINKNSKEADETVAIPCEKSEDTHEINLLADKERDPLIHIKSFEINTAAKLSKVPNGEINKIINAEHFNSIEKENLGENSTAETVNFKYDSQIHYFDLAMQEELTESEEINLDSSDVKINPEPSNNFSRHVSSSKKPMSMKRSLSETDLSSLINSGESEAPSLWPNKRKKLVDVGDKMYPQMLADNCRNIIQNSRRNSLSSICNESNVSYCIFIDNACLLPENCSDTEKIQCITEIAEDCLSCVNNDPIVGGIDSSAEIVSFVEEMNEYSNSYPTEECTNDDEGGGIEASWVDDVACVETVVSDDIAEDIIIGASTPPGELSDTEYDEEESEVLNINDHSEKVKYIYGDKMCRNDAQLLETLYRTPQMNVNQKLINRESPDTDEDYRYYDRDSLEKVLSESSSNVSNPEVIYEPESVAFNTSSLYSPGLEVLENDKENVDLDTFSNPASPFHDQTKEFVNNEEMSAMENCDKTQDHTVHSCESSIDNVFSYNQKEETPKCVISSSPEVSSTTSEEKNSTILLKITNLRNARVSQPSCDDLHKRISCKYTETNDYLNTDVRTPARPLITKAAQKYIPPLKETLPNLKVKLTLPQHSLLRLKQMKVTKDNPALSIKVENRPNVLDIENIPNVVHIQNIPNDGTVQSRPKLVNTIRKDIPKKVKPKFEDVLKSIEEIQIQMHKEKSKKTKKAVPKVVIKKNRNGSHYASTSDSDTSAPDLTGRKWQPWVFLEKNRFIDKMAAKGTTLAVYSHRKKTYVLAENFKKYKSIESTKFVISKPKLEEPSSGRLKYTIRLKHGY